MYSELKNQFGGITNLIKIATAIMLRLPLVFIGKISDDTIQTLVNLSAPHRLFITLPSADPKDVDTIISSESKEAGRRVVIYIPNLIKEPNIQKGWIATVESETILNKRQQYCVYNLEKNKIENFPPDMNFLFRDVRLLIEKIMQIEKLFDTEEANLYARSLFNSLLAQFEIINNHILTNYKSIKAKNFENWFFSAVDQFLTYKEYLLLGIYIYAQEYHSKLLEIAEKFNFKIVSTIRKKEVIQLNPNFLAIIDILGADNVSKLFPYVLIGVPILIKCESKIADVFLESLGFVVKHRTILKKVLETKIAYPHLYLLKNIRSVPKVKFDYIATTTKENVIREFRKKEFYVIADIEKKQIYTNIQFPKMLTNILKTNNEVVIEEYITHYVNQLLIQAELLMLYAKKHGFSKSLGELPMRLTNFEKILLIGISRAENPINTNLLEILKLLLSGFVRYAYPYLVFRKPLIKKQIIELLSDSKRPELMLRIFALKILNFHDIWTIVDTNRDDFFAEMESLINKGVLHLE